MDQECIDKLAGHLWARHNASTGHRIDSTLGHVAYGILADPQAHVDALVEAGVLYLDYADMKGNKAYAVVQPQPTLCRHCGERIKRWTYSENGNLDHSIRPGWKHANGLRQCTVVAEPEEVA